MTVALVSTAAAALIGFVYPQDAFGGATTTVYFFYATLGTLAVILVYIMLCLGGMAFFRRTKASYNPVLHAAVPLIGAVVFGAAFYGSVYPQPPFPLNLTPYITGIWLVVGHRCGARAALPKPRRRGPDRVDPRGGGRRGRQAAWMIDDHVHPFPLAFEPLDLARFTLDVGEGDEADRRRLSIEPTRLVDRDAPRAPGATPGLRARGGRRSPATRLPPVTGRGTCADSSPTPARPGW